MPTWEYHLLRQGIADGRVAAAPDLGALAACIGVDPLALARSVERYNADCDAGVDRDFFKQMPERYPVRRAPFYAREVRACVIGQTGAGLDVTARAEVLDEHGVIVPGLYAAGEVLGCAVGKRYSGGGMGICNAMVFGRIAGAAAAEDAMGSRAAR
jgi:fumarate reductase flavoprotein subunit